MSVFTIACGVLTKPFWLTNGGGLEADFGSLEELLAELLAGWMATGWLADGLVAAGWLAGRPQGPQVETPPIGWSNPCPWG